MKISKIAWSWKHSMLCFIIGNLFLISIFYIVCDQPICAVIVFLPLINLLGLICACNNPYSVGKCKNGCSVFYSEIIEFKGSRGMGELTIRCNKCGNVRKGTEYIGFD